MNPDEIYKVANQARRGMLCIPLSRLKPHPHQRELDMAHVANLQDKMNTDSFNQNAYPIMVAPMEAISEEENAKINIYEGGNLAVLEDDATLTGYFILAGLHRIEACRRSGILSWPAIVYDHGWWFFSLSLLYAHAICRIRKSSFHSILDVPG